MRPVSLPSSLPAFMSPSIYARPHRRVRLVAQHDPLARVSVRGYTLADLGSPGVRLSLLGQLRNLNQVA